MIKKIVIFAVIIGVGFAAFSCQGGWRETGPEDALLAFVQLWDQEDYDGMYALLSDQAQEEWDKENFTTRYANISGGIRLKSVKVIESSVNDGICNYVLEFDTETVGKFEQEYSIEIVRQGEWGLNWGHEHILPGLSADTVVRVTRQMARRGSILDRNGNPLAAMGSVYNIGLVPGKMDDTTVPLLAGILDMSTFDILRLLDQSWVGPETFVPVKLAGQQTWLSLRDSLTILKGVTVREQVGRVYDIPESLAQTVGYVAEISSERLEQVAELGFRSGDFVGSAGIELLCDGELMGRPGFTITIRDSSGSILETVAQRGADDGLDILTSLDLEKIKLMDQALGNRKGSIILMDYSGAIIGVVSKPGFDSNLFSLGISPAQYSALQELDSPFLNRAFNGLYPPGSVFKPITTLMALEEGVFDPDYQWDTPRHWQSNSSWGTYHVTRVLRPTGPVDLRQAMKWSDNVYFAELGLKVGWQAFESYADSLGFSKSLPFKHSYTQSQVRKGNRSEILLADSSYGQGEMLTSPLHISLMYAAIARQDGVIPRPHLIPGDEDLWLETGFDADNLDLVDRVLAYAASDHNALAWVGSETVRGKTGTSEISQERQIAWYVCYFDDLILTVTLEGNRSISSPDAVNVARECLDNGIRN